MPPDTRIHISWRRRLSLSAVLALLWAMAPMANAHPDHQGHHQPHGGDDHEHGHH